MVGRLLWFNELKGYGEIEAENGDRFFFTKKDQKDLSSKLTANTTVNFSKSTEILFESYRAKSVEELKATKKKPLQNSREARV